MPHSNKPQDTKISQACDLTPNEQSLLVMRATLLVQVVESLGELGAQCQQLGYELSQLSYLDTVERSKLQTNIEHKREQYRFAKNSLSRHTSNLARVLSDIQSRRLGESPLAPVAGPCDNKE